MIVVKVELHSVVTGKVNDLGTMIIDNIGGTRSRGDYRCRMYHKGAATKYGVRGLLMDTKPIREGTVTHHARLAEPVQNLVAKALTAMGYQ